MQIDPLADFMPGINPYQFAFNNPVSFNDPYGLSPKKCHDKRCRVTRRIDRIRGRAAKAKSQKKRNRLNDRARNIEKRNPNLFGTRTYLPQIDYNFKSPVATPERRNYVVDLTSKPLSGPETGPTFAPIKPVDTPPEVPQPSLNRIFTDSEDDDGGITINFPSDELFELGKTKVIMTPKLERFGHALRDHSFVNVTMIIQMVKPPNARRGDPNSEQTIIDRARAIQKALIDLGASPRQVRDWFGTYGDNLPNVTFKAKDN